MGFFDILVHLLGFAAPAVALGILMPLAARLLLAPGHIVTGFWRQAAVVSACGVAVLGGGLWFFSHDGKMATYGALVVVASLVQWALVRGWRR
ncbi:MAG: hypothetical protein RIS88_1301 [Pseudomonadota bacterium]|jgi:hypothetical protein